MAFGSRLLATLLLAATAGAAGAGCSSKPSHEQCEQVLRHVIDLEAAEGGGAAAGSDKADLDQQKKKVFDAVSPGAMSFCLDQMSTQQVSCGLKAKTLAELSKTCDKG